MSGAHTNLNEYPSAAQLKNVTADFLTPASVSHADSVEKINRIGMPAEKPKNSMVMTRGCRNGRRDSINLDEAGGAVMACLRRPKGRAA